MRPVLAWLAGSCHWLKEPEPSCIGVRWLFLRLLGCIYLVAFISLWSQVHGLIGSHGILPVADFLSAANGLNGPSRILQVPTLCWISASDHFLTGLCAGGSIFALLLIVGVAPIPI